MRILFLRRGNFRPDTGLLLNFWLDIYQFYTIKKVHCLFNPKFVTAKLFGMRKVLFIQGETALDLQFNLERIWPHCLIIHAGQLGGRGIHQNARQMLDWLKRSSTKYFTNIIAFKESYRLRSVNFWQSSIFFFIFWPPCLSMFHLKRLVFCEV